jgi:hypothetical protein
MKCEACKGIGKDERDGFFCEYCGGRGWLEDYESLYHEDEYYEEEDGDEEWEYIPVGTWDDSDDDEFYWGEDGDDDYDDEDGGDHVVHSPDHWDNDDDPLPW